jgi:predicted nucleic acid-binding protein
VKRIAIVDNTVLSNLVDVGLSESLDKIRAMFERLYIPEKILEEFLNVPEPYLSVRQRFADSILYDRGFFRRCNTFDPIILGVLQTQPGIDAGESEAIAQAVKHGVLILLTDDTRCKNYVKKNYSYIICYNTPFLIALLDLNRFIVYPELVWKSLYARHRFKSSDLRNAYLDACNLIGFSPDRKFLNAKCSMKRILKS